MCEVFFFGTAFNIPSQISATKPGILMDIAGIAMEDDQRLKRRDGNARVVDCKVEGIRLSRSSMADPGPMAAALAIATIVRFPE